MGLSSSPAIFDMSEAAAPAMLPKITTGKGCQQPFGANSYQTACAAAC
jgi:hypothetical protein